MTLRAHVQGEKFNGIEIMKNARINNRMNIHYFSIAANCVDVKRAQNPFDDVFSVRIRNGHLTCGITSSLLYDLTFYVT